MPSGTGDLNLPCESSLFLDATSQNKENPKSQIGHRVSGISRVPQSPTPHEIRKTGVRSPENKCNEAGAPRPTRSVAAEISQPRDCGEPSGKSAGLGSVGLW